MPELYRQLVDANGDYLLSSTGDNLYVKASQVSTFTINLYQLSGEKIMVNKTEYITSVGNLTGTLRNGTSIVNPSITIEMTNVPTFNYVYISVFSRYYFVDNITSVVNNLWLIDLSCDVLFSYKSQINQQSGFIARNEYLYKTSIPDNATGLTYNITRTRTKGVLTQDSPAWFGSKNYFKDDASVGNQNHRYVCKVVGTPKCYIDAQHTAEPIKTSDATANIVMSASKWGDFMKLVRSNNMVQSITQSNIVQYVTECFCIPVQPFLYPNTPDGHGGYTYYECRRIDTPALLDFITYDGTGGVPYLMGIDPTSNLITPYNNNFLRSVVWKIELPEIFYDEEFYKNYMPCRKISLQFQPFGVLTLDFSWFNLNESTDIYEIYIRASVSVITGEASLYWGNSDVLTNNDCGTPNFLTSASVKIDLPLMPTTINYGGVLATGLEKIASGKGIKAVNVGSTLFNVLDNANHPETNVMNAGYSIIDDAPLLIVEDQEQIESNNSLFGRPLEATKQLGVLTGYTQVKDVHLEGFTTATQTEIDEIESLLKSGVIF